MQKKRIISGFLILLCMELLGGCAGAKQKYSEFMDIEEQWGLINWGQKVKDSPGKADIDIGISNLWKITKGKKEILIGIIDSGIEKNEDIKHALYVNQDEIPGNGIDDDKNGYVDDINGWNFYDNSNEIYTDYLSDYHGTAIAEIIAGKHKKGSYFGVAPDVTILPLKAFSGTTGDVKDIIKAIDYASAQGVRILNLSWDLGTYNEELYNKIKECENILFVCSTSKNTCDLEYNKIYPACFDLENIIVVGSVNNQGKLGEGGYGKLVDVVAPGENILCAFPENEKVFMEGGSFATAYVSGIAGLILSEYPELPPVKLREYLMRGALALEVGLEDKVRLINAGNTYDKLSEK